jgi:hypothetical protein
MADKYIQLTFIIGEGLKLKSIMFDDNETELPSDSATLKALCTAMLKGLADNESDVAVWDLLNQLGIRPENG